MRLLSLTAAAEPVEVPNNAECQDCDADDGPFEAVVVLNGLPTCSRCLHELTLVGLTLVEP